VVKIVRAKNHELAEANFLMSCKPFVEEMDHLFHELAGFRNVARILILESLRLRPHRGPYSHNKNTGKNGECNKLHKSNEGLLREEDFD